MILSGGPISAGSAGAGHPGQLSPALPPPLSPPLASPSVSTSMAHSMQQWQWMLQQQQSRLQPPQPMQHWQQGIAVPAAKDWWTENPGQTQTTVSPTATTISRHQAGRNQPQQHLFPHIEQQTSGQGTNPVIHHHSYSVKSAIIISRLLCGGQGLNAGDPLRPTEVCMRKACKYCLSLGQPKSETLWHFLHECPLTAKARQSKEAKQCWSQPENIAKLHLTIWSNKQIRTIRNTLKKMWQLGQAFNAALAGADSSSFHRSHTTDQGDRTVTAKVSRSGVSWPI